jgi:hypothetical protein
MAHFVNNLSVNIATTTFSSKIRFRFQQQARDQERSFCSAYEEAHVLPASFGADDGLQAMAKDGGMSTTLLISMCCSGLCTLALAKTDAARAIEARGVTRTSWVLLQSRSGTQTVQQLIASAQVGEVIRTAADVMGLCMQQWCSDIQCTATLMLAEWWQNVDLDISCITKLLLVAHGHCIPMNNHVVEACALALNHDVPALTGPCHVADAQDVLPQCKVP